jgi:hypothetical protein
VKYAAIRSEGGLLPYDLLDEILADTAIGQKPADFSLPKGRRVSDEIQRVWSDAQELWSRFKAGREKLPEKDPNGTTLTRDRWIGPLLTDPVRLSYDLHYQPSALIQDGMTFAISHRAGEPADSPPVHIEGCEIELDKRPPKYRTSPQAMVQEFLNRSELQLWGVVTNGLRFRLLRDSVRTARPTYLEFDLETILEGGHYNEFALFYRLCHRTRLPQSGHPPENCLLEKYHQLSIEKGGRVRDNLRDGVEEALKVLGTGFLRHADNSALREKVISSALTAEKYHRQLLLLVYRLLFLTVAEDRHLVISIGENADRNQTIYRDNYSIGCLRDRASGMLEDSGFSDLWIGLTQTFKLFSDSSDTNPLGIPPLNGDLFSHTTIPDLEAAHLSNLDLLKAVRWLMFYRERNVQQRVNYAALNVEELGSVYESLPDFRPLVSKEPEGLRFELGVGSERKTTGSYYTRPELVRELIQSALVPVMEDRLEEAEKEGKGQPAATVLEAKIKAILQISVCDPACGSGHFLLEAARRLGKELSQIRVGDDEPTPEQFHIAVRDVISHCVHGVDLNPLAVDLCKLALWLEGHWAGKPLSFLDHRIKCGNSLIGVLDPRVMEKGIPDDAFKSVTGDDKKVASAFKKRNRNERSAPTLSQKRLGFEATVEEHLREYVSLAQQLTDFPEDRPADVKRKVGLYGQSRANVHWFRDSQLANAWTGSFFIPLVRHNDPSVPTYETFLEFLSGRVHQPQFVPATEALAGQLQFFHWFLEFPEVFAKGGFDVLLGNPPWEMLQPEEVKFFAAANAPEIANLPGAQRKAEIANLTQANPQLAKAWHNYQRNIETHNKFIREGGRFVLTAVGKLNTYALFAELGRDLVNKMGTVGIIVPTGIATDDTNKQFFADLNQKRTLVSLYDFENREGIFPGVHRSYKFSLLTLSELPVPATSFACFLARTEHLRDANRRFELSPEELGLLNPNTRTCPIFRTRADADLTKKIYRRAPILIDETKSQNPWRIEFRQGLFNMTSDSGLFRTNAGHGLLPLYEAKMIHQFDHRFATYEGGETRDCTDGEKADPSFTICPRYWVSAEDVRNQLSGWQHSWFVGFRDIARSTDERTVIFSLIPYSGVGNKIPLLFFKDADAALIACFLAMVNSMVFDYAARQKVGSTTLNFFIVKQFPALAPEALNSRDKEFIVPRSLELMYTAIDLGSFAEETGYLNPPHRWDAARREQIRAELDAYYAHLYGLTHDELRFVLDPKDVFGDDFPSETFRVLKEREEKEFGEYRTQRLVLGAFDKLAESPRFRDEISKRQSALGALSGQSEPQEGVGADRRPELEKSPTKLTGTQ